MGKKYSKEGKDYFKKNYFNCHFFINKEKKIIHEKTKDGKMLDLLDYFQSNYRGWTKFVYYDFSIFFTRQLDGLKHSENFYKGSFFVNRLYNVINRYKKLHPKVVLLGLDGNPKKRPKIKEKRNKNKNAVMVESEDIEISSGTLNFDSKIWRDNRSNNKIRFKVFGYLTHELNKRWKKSNIFTELILDCATINDSNDNPYYSATSVSKKRITEIQTADTCEGEQIIYRWLSKHCKSHEKSLHIIEGGNDTDHYTYPMLFQQKYPNSRIIIKLVHYTTVIDGTEYFPTAKSYFIDVTKLNGEIIKDVKLKKNVNFDIIKMVCLLWGMLTGNDFVWSFDKEKELDWDDPKRKYYLKSIIRGVNTEKLLNAAIEENKTYIKEGKTLSGKTKFFLNKDEFFDIFKKIKRGKRDTLDEDLFDDKQIDHLEEILRRSQWCLNYFLNPADDEFLGYKHYRKRKNVNTKRVKIV